MNAVKVRQDEYNFIKKENWRERMKENVLNFQRVTLCVSVRKKKEREIERTSFWEVGEEILSAQVWCCLLE